MSNETIGTINSCATYRSSKKGSEAERLFVHTMCNIPNQRRLSGEELMDKMLASGKIAIDDLNKAFKTNSLDLDGIKQRISQISLDDSCYDIIINDRLDRILHIDYVYYDEETSITSLYEIKSNKSEEKHYHSEPMLLLEIRSVKGHEGGWGLNSKAEYFIFFVKSNNRTFYIKAEVDAVKSEIILPFIAKKPEILTADGEAEDKGRAANVNGTFNNGKSVTRRSWDKKKQEFVDREDEFFYYRVEDLATSMPGSFKCYKLSSPNDIEPIEVDLNELL